MTPVSPANRVADLGRELGTEMADARVEMEFFPSGAAWLDVRRDGRLFSLNYDPSHGVYGVFEVTEEHVLDSGPCEVFDDLDSAAARLREIIAAAPIPRV